ncbi:MAG: hypothetical protein HDR53_04865, partial [Treponema sp.]|nr:hypothetical protein [Treponema sp.]
KTVYVRGTGGYYDTNSPYNQDGNAMADDEHTGSFLSPLASIQKAIDKIIAINDGTSAYTICVDGTLDGKTATRLGTSGMATISAYKQDLNLTIKALSEKATLDGGARFTVDENDCTVTVTEEGIKKRIIYAASTSCKLDLSLENLVIMGGNPGDHGGGIYFKATGGSMLNMKGCKISGNNATKDFNQYNGGGIYVTSSTCECTMEDCEISGNATYYTGGGIYVEYSTFTMKSGTISDNTVVINGGGIAVESSSGNFIMNGGTIEKNKARNGGGVEIYNGTFTMNGGTVSNNIASNNGGGSYSIGGTFEMNGGTFSGNKATNEGNGARIEMTTKFKIKGDAKFADDDGINLFHVYITGALTEEKVATITLSSYTVGKKVLYADGEPITPGICDKFILTPASDGKEWKIVPNDDGTAGALGIESVFLNSSSGDDANSGLTASKAVKTLSKAIELFESQNAKKIMICAEYTLPSGESTLLDRMGGGRRNLPLVRYDGSSDVSSSFTETLLTISQGDVTITNVTLDGRKEKVTASGALLDIDGSTTIVTLGDGATVCNNKKTQWGSGSGVHIGDGTFKMIGGTVTGNEGRQGYGLGVYINDNATFEMSGGKISGNSENNSAGGGVYNRGTFIMSGGEISGNKVGSGGGVYITNAAAKGFFTMTGGKIINNTAQNHGGGVCGSGTFTMENGEITGNTAPSGNGVYIIGDGNFTHTGGTVQED